MSLPQNLLVRSEAFDNASWSKLNFTITPNVLADPLTGATTADLFTDSNDSGTPSVHACLQVVSGTTAPSGLVYTFSAYFKDASGGATPWIAITCESGASAFFVNLTDGSFPNTIGDIIDYGVEAVGSSGWWRVWCAMRLPTLLSGFSAGVYSATNSTNVTYAGTGSARFWMWGAQVVRSATEQPYVATTTQPIDDGAWCRPRALGRQNLLQWSESLQTAPWTANTGVTATDGTTDLTAPDGTNTATKIVYGGGLAPSSILFYQYVNAAVAAQVGELGGVGVWMRTASGTITLALSENWSASSSIITVTSTWQFFSRIAPSAGLYNAIFALYMSGAPASLTFYMWHPQAMVDSNQLGPYGKTKGNCIGATPIGRRLRRIGIGEIQNLLMYSEQLDNATQWSALFTTVSPNVAANPVDGASTADRITEDTSTNIHIVGTSTTVAAQGEGALMTASVFYKNVDRQYAGIHVGNTLAHTSTFDLVNGVVVAATANLVNATIEPYPNGWFRCSISWRAEDNGTTIAYFYLSPNTGLYTSYPASGKSVLIFGAQVVAGGLAPYTPSTSAPIGASNRLRSPASVPQNVVPYSEQFDQSVAWTPVGATVTANALANPINGATDADALVDTAGLGAHSIFLTATYGATFPEGAPVCCSCFIKLAKPGSAPAVLVSASGGLGGGGTYYNLVTGARSDVLFSDTYSRCEDVGGGWFRLSIFGRSRGGTTQMSIALYADIAGTQYTGNGAVTAYLWGGSITATREPVPYIKSGANPVGSLPAGINTPAPGRYQALAEQNIILNSEAFDAWNASDVTITANAVPGPFGGANSAEKFTDGVDGSPQAHYAFEPPFGSAEVGDRPIATFSVYLKPIAGAGNSVLIGPNGTNVFAIFDLVAGTVLSSAANAGYDLLGYGIVPVGTTGWWRCWVVTRQVTNMPCYVWACQSGGTSYTGTGSDRFYMWGAQLSLSLGPIPYVKSSASFTASHGDARPVRAPA